MDTLVIAAWQADNPHAFIALELTLPDAVHATKGQALVSVS